MESSSDDLAVRVQRSESPQKDHTLYSDFKSKHFHMQINPIIFRSRSALTYREPDPIEMLIIALGRG